MDDLVYRIKREVMRGNSPTNAVLYEAADRIEALEARCAKLQAWHDAVMEQPYWECPEGGYDVIERPKPVEEDKP